MLLYSRWCALTLPTRNKLAEIFGIEKKGATEVASNVVKHDGYLVEDIEQAMTVEAMQKYLSAGNTDISELWNMTIDKIEGREVEGLTSLPEKTMAVLPEEEAKQFKKEYKARTIKTKVVKPKTPKTNAKTKTKK